METGTAASLQEQLSQYYEYFSTLHKGPSGIIWTEPYLDAFGADMVVTAAKAVYDSSNTSQSRLVAVVAIDISYAHIQQVRLGPTPSQCHAVRKDFLLFILITFETLYGLLSENHNFS